MERYRKEIAILQDNGGYRSLKDTSQGINLSSNDYMGIGNNIPLWEEFVDQTRCAQIPYQGGSCSSRLLTGNHKGHALLENLLSQSYGGRSALVFNSGYHANVGILPALATKRDLILADKKVHASLIDALQLTSATVYRYPHNDYTALEKLLHEKREDYDYLFIVTESLFSMDGDKSDLSTLVEIKNRYNGFLYIDEAHAIGVRGERGLGCAQEQGLLQEIDLLVGTFGKAVASQGAFLIADPLWRDYLINKMRPLIFSTALPDWSLRWTAFVWQKLLTMNAEREALRDLSLQCRSALFDSSCQLAKEDSPIVPYPVGDNHLVTSLSAQCCRQGYHLLPIRVPTVPKGEEKLRISLSASLTIDQLQPLFKILCP